MRIRLGAVVAGVFLSVAACGGGYPGVALPHHGSARPARSYGPVAVPPRIATAPGAAQYPTLAQIQQQMARVHPGDAPAERYAPGAFVEVAPDGAGGSVTVALARRQLPVAPGTALESSFVSRVAFFWHDKTFVGVDSPRESPVLDGVSASGTTVTVDYRVDGGERQVMFAWDGKRFRVVGRPPGGGTRLFMG